MSSLRPRTVSPGDIEPRLSQEGLARSVPRSVEQRGVTRRRALLSGKFVFDQPRHSVDCVIRDLSEVGARIVFAPRVVPRGRGWLIDLRAGFAHDAVVIWRASGLLGVKFVETIDVTTSAPGPLSHLHRLWAESAEHRRGLEEIQRHALEGRLRFRLAPLAPGVR
jgi:hypothetical protein